MRIIILVAAGALVVLVCSGLALARRQVKVKLLPGQLYFICPGGIATLALLFHIGGAVIALSLLGTAALWGERFWATITGIVPYRPFWFPLWASVLLGGVVVSAFGFMVGLLTASKKNCGLDQRMRAVIQRLT